LIVKGFTKDVKILSWRRWAINSVIGQAEIKKIALIGKLLVEK
jgi:hypothetical protein